MLGLASVTALDRDDEGVRQVALTLGQLRQLADELLDVAEDLASGLITLPVAYALRNRTVGPRVRTIARHLWRYGAETDSDVVGELGTLLHSAGVSDPISQRADQLLSDSIQAAERIFPDPLFAQALLIQRRMQIERAIAQNFTDTRPRVSVEDLLRLPLDTDWRSTTIRRMRELRY